MPRTSLHHFGLYNDYRRGHGGLHCGGRLLRVLPLLASAWCLLFGAFAAGAQTVNVQSAQNAVDFKRRSLAEIDPATLGLQLRISLGDYPGRAGTSLPVTLYYSSKLWRVKFLNTTNSGGITDTRFQAMYAETSDAGWTSNLDFFRWPNPNPPGPEKYNLNGKLVSGTTYNFTVARMYVNLPDGSRHELRRDDTRVGVGSDYTSGTFYSVDGSRLRYDSATKTLYMPDGSRLVTETDAGGVPLYLHSIDRNGNRSTYDYSTGQWTDTMGRTFVSPLPPKAGVTSEPAVGDSVYSLPGTNGTQINYTFRWRSLSEVLLDAGQALSYKGDRSIPYPHAALSPSLFASSDSDNSVVSDGMPFNPVVLSQIVLPTGQAYTFKYNVWGEIVRIGLPTGGYETFAYDSVPPLSGQLDDGLYSQANRGVTRHVVSDGVTASSWSYATAIDTSTIPHHIGRKVTAPDLSYTETYYHDSRGADIKFGFDDERAGRAYDERAYSASGQMLRRTLTKWAQTGPVPYDPNSTATRDARPERKVEILLDTGGQALATTTKYGYDSDLNQIWQERYAFVTLDQTTAQTVQIDSVAQGTLLRREETDYLTSDQNYRDRNLLGLPTATRVKDGAGNVVAQTQVFYDETALATYGAVTNWTDPGTSARGNATRTSRWLDTTNTWVETRAEYDQCGNPVKAVDALGNESSASYSAAYARAYPTQTASAVPDPSGVYGSATALTTSTAYDFSTGLVTSVTDANTQTTHFSYSDDEGHPDPLDRLKTVTRPDGGWTKYDYGHNQYGDYVHTRTLMDSSGRETSSYDYTDGLGRPYRSFLYENQDASKPWLTTDTEYDAMGRVKRASRPYRSTGSAQATFSGGRWAETSYDSLSRVLDVTTRPDGAVVTTSYAGNAVTVTDQAGRKRRSVTDALGRLVRVDEPDAQGGNLDDAQSNPVQSTSYGYDALGNLLGVTQGAQTRSFVYDSLSRLRSATNPESGTVSYTYDANGNLKTKTDARGVTTTYTYDALNRNTLVAYTDGTRGVKRIYDGAANGRGRFYAAWTWDGVSTYYDHAAVDGYDAAGRPLNRRQHFYRNNAPGQAFNTVVTYNLAGSVTSETYPSGHSVTYNYDAAGRLGDVAAAGGTLPAMSGNLGGEQRTYSSEVLYDETGGMSQERFGTDTPLYHKLHYNPRGQLYDIRLSTQSLAANQWDWDRGAIINYYSGNFAWEGNPSTPAAADNNGNLREQQHWVPDGNGGHTYTEQTYTYDALNRLKSVAEAAGGSGVQRVQSFAQAYTYDRWGNRTINATATSNAPAPQYELDATRNDNRLYAPGDTATSDLPQRRMRYDAAGNLTRDVCGNNALCARSYDAENRMVSAQTAGAQSAVYTYDADGRRVRRNDGVAEVWQVYGVGGELVAEYAKDTSYLQPQKEYGYRGGELLVTAEPSSGWGPAPTFTGPDPLSKGDRILLEHLTDLRTAVNQLRGHAGLTNYDFTVDPNPERKVTAVKAEHVRQLRRALEEALTRLGRPVGGYAHQTLTENVSPVYAIDFQELREQVRGAWRSDAGGVDIRWLVVDQLGTPRMAADKTGSLAGVTRHDYLPFGEDVAGDSTWRTPERGYKGDTVRQKFTQKERDTETNLDFFEARYYSSTMGRFTSPDEFTGGPDELYNFVDDASDNPTFYADLTNPQSLNKYQYAYNNPLRYVDPNGHCPAGATAICAEGAAVVGGSIAGPVGAVAAFTIYVVVDQTVGWDKAGSLSKNYVADDCRACRDNGRFGVYNAEDQQQRQDGGAQGNSGTQDNSGAKPADTGGTNGGGGRRGGREGRPFTRKGKKEVIDRNREKNAGKTKCENCGVETVPSKKSESGVRPPRNETQVDHINPRSKGGSGTPDNGQVLCRGCNREKSDHEE